MKYVIANWKMNMDTDSINEWFSQFQELYSNKNPDVTIIIAGSFLHLSQIKKWTDELGCEAAAQNVSLFEKGAHTGSVGAFQLEETCKYSIVGHSELEENHTTALQKRDKCLQYGIIPIVCFAQKNDIKDSLAEHALVAWEDPNSISVNGAYRASSMQEIENTFLQFANDFPKIEIIYGGSVNKTNVSDLAKIPNLGGVLVGNASLDPKHFIDLIEAF